MFGSILQQLPAVRPDNLTAEPVPRALAAQWRKLQAERAAVYVAAWRAYATAAAGNLEPFINWRRRVAD